VFSGGFSLVATAGKNRLNIPAQRSHVVAALSGAEQFALRNLLAGFSGFGSRPPR